jgi:hypothetical protein
VVERLDAPVGGQPEPADQFSRNATSDYFTESAENFSEKAKIFSQMGGSQSRTTVPGQLLNENCSSSPQVRQEKRSRVGESIKRLCSESVEAIEAAGAYVVYLPSYSPT